MFLQCPYDLSEDLLLDIVIDKQISESADSIPVGDLLRRRHSAEIREGAAVEYLIHYRHIGKVIKILKNMYSQHQLDRIRLLSDNPFIVYRLYYRNPILLWNRRIHFLEELSFVCLSSLECVTKKRSLKYTFHTFIISYFLAAAQVVRCCSR